MTEYGKGSAGLALPLLPPLRGFVDKGSRVSVGLAGRVSRLLTQIIGQKSEVALHSSFNATRDAQQLAMEEKPWPQLSRVQYTVFGSISFVGGRRTVGWIVREPDSCTMRRLAWQVARVPAVDYVFHSNRLTF